MLCLGKKEKASIDAGNGVDESNAVNDPNPVVASDSNNEADVQCPPHTTESKLLWKIDYHVVPFLCVMYLLAFLGERLGCQASDHTG